MKSSHLMLAALAALVLATAQPAPAAAPAAGTDDAVTLEGSFIWDRQGKEHTGDLEAVLTPAAAADDEWTVAFHFTWEGEPHVFEGKAKGSVESGPLHGTAESDDESHKLSFQFRGDVEEGVFTGTHGYIKRDGSLQEAGTLTLERVN